MDAGPGTDLGAFGWYVGIWVTMMAAMMLPSVAPMVLVFARISRERAARGHEVVPTWLFLAGYLATWTAYGVLAYGVYRALDPVDLGLLHWDRGGPYVAGAVLAAAGIYELTPLKRVCLRHCRGPCTSSSAHGDPAPRAPSAWASNTVSSASAAAGD